VARILDFFLKNKQKRVVGYFLVRKNKGRGFELRQREKFFIKLEAKHLTEKSRKHPFSGLTGG